MADIISPTKRRKAQGLLASNPKKSKPESTWPMSNGRSLPVEIFVIIASYLPRRSIQEMRLVCKEFEGKVSEYLFRIVVVPFKPEIYGITPEPGSGRGQQETVSVNGSVMLQDKGMRVFHGFGSHIKKFALSFELDEEKLARPPIKSEQEAIVSFWGIYRWPYMSYNRYAQLEGLEQTADETRTMAKALRFITNASELGLSVDGGLGWLSGPDINLKVLERGDLPDVFGDSRFVSDPLTKLERAKKIKAKLAFHSNAVAEDKYIFASERAAQERMLRNAGYSDSEMPRALQTLEYTETCKLTDQHLTSQPTINQPPPTRADTPRGSMRRSATRQLPTSLSPQGAPMSPASSSQTLGVPDPNRDTNSENSSSVVASDNDEEFEGILASITSAAPVTFGKVEVAPLKPNELNNAQKEMLLEVEWAQRAFMQSYTIAIIDNLHTFKAVRTLTIARLPNRHLPILRREDFWDSLPQLEKLSIAIIPDWREVVKLPTSWVQDEMIQPSRSVSGVHQLLKDQISQRKNITSLHFEWLCGGEEAPGICARNQHILAAPLLSEAKEMVDRRRQVSLLELPYIKNLSLKNCWISPHILIEFATSLKKARLESLSLESISLSAPIARGTTPSPLNGHQANNQAVQNAHAQALAHAQAQANAIGVVVGNNGQPALPILPNLHLQQPLPPPMLLHHANQQVNPHQLANQPVNQQAILQPPAGTAPISLGSWYDQPRNGSWAHIVDLLTPGYTLADHRFHRNKGPEPLQRAQSCLRQLQLNSCGYVRLSLDYDQTMLDPPEVPTAHPSVFIKRLTELETLMMKPNDFYLGVIINHVDPNEERTLELAWNMRVGWDELRTTLAAEALLDGIRAPGQGRITGLIEAPTQS
ncbi:F-box domain-containing protein [Phlyctema vagabunda]|uniref:F-box domain-containing protein n=1 Tax=Phlyctema vagabunda TaxID=108571 RepID=A0ABR4PN71_9HELO